MANRKIITKRLQIFRSAFAFHKSFWLDNYWLNKSIELPASLKKQYNCKRVLAVDDQNSVAFLSRTNQIFGLSKTSTNRTSRAIPGKSQRQVGRYRCQKWSDEFFPLSKKTIHLLGGFSFVIQNQSRPVAPFTMWIHIRRIRLPDDAVLSHTTVWSEVSHSSSYPRPHSLMNLENSDF